MRTTPLSTPSSSSSSSSSAKSLGRNEAKGFEVLVRSEDAKGYPGIVSNRSTDPSPLSDMICSASYVLLALRVSGCSLETHEGRLRYKVSDYRCGNLIQQPVPLSG